MYYKWGKFEHMWVIGRKARGKEATRKTMMEGGWIILGSILERWDGVMWTELVWLKIGSGGELL
jgi:hypothetical protein